MVIALNVSRAASRSAASRAAGSTAASVVRNPSIVARFGSTIPAPFAMPPMVKPPRGVATRTAASLGTMSVVMIAWAASRCALRLRPRAASSIPAVTLPVSRRIPMTPVEAMSTWAGSQPTAAAAAATMARAAARPSAPVQALAHRLLTAMTRARPPERSSCSRATTTGAATARLVVKRPAALAGSSETTRATSSPDGLSPHATPAAR